jgi:dephospho-CoA kinase
VYALGLDGPNPPPAFETVPSDVASVRRIGLTGGIGSGKSTVAALLVSKGALLIDTDGIGRDLTQSHGAAIPAIREAFGTRAIDASNALDRERMRGLVFADPQARRKLESILHPMIGAESERRAAAARATVVVFDVPLLTESTHWRAKVDRVLLVDCDEATQIDRVLKRSQWERAIVEQAIGQQASRQARRAIADAVIFNQDLSLSELALEVDALWCRWCSA